MRYTGPKNRIARREAMDLGLKTPGTKSHASLLKRLNSLPGQHGTPKRRKTSEYGRQVREKQKLRFIFGVTEHQLKNYFKKSVKKTGNTGLYLSQFLEQRLDNIVYRMGFVPTRAAARQLVTHKHIKVNDKTLNVPSHQVKPGDIISLAKPNSEKIPQVESSLSRKDEIMPEWVERKGTVGKVKVAPTADLVEKQINLRLVVEFYSR
jgi:small subunit ribosomal protein S4